MESHMGQKMRLNLLYLEKGRNPRERRPKAKTNLVRMVVRKRRILARSSVFIIMSLDIMLQNSQTQNPKNMLQQ